MFTYKIASKIDCQVWKSIQPVTGGLPLKLFIRSLEPPYTPLGVLSPISRRSPPPTISGSAPVRRGVAYSRLEKRLLLSTFIHHQTTRAKMLCSKLHRPPSITLVLVSSHVRGHWNWSHNVSQLTNNRSRGRCGLAAANRTGWICMRSLVDTWRTADRCVWTNEQCANWTAVSHRITILYSCWRRQRSSCVYEPNFCCTLSVRVRGVQSLQTDIDDFTFIASSLALISPRSCRFVSYCFHRPKIVIIHLYEHELARLQNSERDTTWRAIHNVRALFNKSNFRFRNVSNFWEWRHSIV